MLLGALLATPLLVLAAGCSLLVDTRGLDNGGADGGDATSASPGPDAPTDSPAIDSRSPPTESGSVPDGGPDAPFELPDGSDDSPSQSDASTSPTTVVNVGAELFSTGYGYQLHLVFAQNDGRYWLFYVDGEPGVIKTRVSADLVDWTAAGSVALPAPLTVADGNSFSVAYADLAGTDVVHVVADGVSAGGDYTAIHIRATIAQGAITALPAVPLPDTGNGGGCPEDGPATVVASDGHVYDVTAWAQHGQTSCDTNIYRSPGADTGATWDSADPFTYDGYYVSVPTLSAAHDLVDLPQTGVVLAVYPDMDNSGNAPTQFYGWGWAFSPMFADAGGFDGMGVVSDPTTELFASSGLPASFDDWAVCRLSDTDIHVVRHVSDAGYTTVSAFEEVVYDGSAWQTTAPPPASVRSMSNTGVALLSNPAAPDEMLMVTIGLDNALNVARWASGAWTQVEAIPGSVQRQSLAGSGCGGARPVVLWTEGADPQASNLMLADLSSLF